MIQSRGDGDNHSSALEAHAAFRMDKTESIFRLVNRSDRHAEKDGARTKLLCHLLGDCLVP